MKTQKCIIYTTLAVVFLYSMVSFMAAVFQCSPVRKFVSLNICAADITTFRLTIFQWQPLLPGTCLKKEVVLPLVFTHSAIIATSDFLFAIIPMFVVSHKFKSRGHHCDETDRLKVWSLQMSRNMKISVSFLMGFGAM
jgi:hypothetical protein